MFVISDVNYETGDFEIYIKICYTDEDVIRGDCTTKDVIMGNIAYDYFKTYNVFELIKENQELKNQQKEFIEYLENEIMEIRAKWGNALSNVSQLDVAMTVKAYEYILLKYKEIIGGDNK